MKNAIIALGLATAVLSFAGKAAVINKPRDYTPQRTGAAASSIVGAADRQIGVVTCGKYFGYAYSLGCKDYKAEGKPIIPYKTLPGYRLGGTISADYEVTAISFDSYNSIATVYFTYTEKK